MKKNIWFVILIAAFLLPLVALGIWSMADVDATTSESENRALKALPEFSLGAFFLEKYTSDFEGYYTDTFPLREKMLSVNGELNKLYYFSLYAADGSDGGMTLVIPHGGDHIADGGEALTTPPPSETPATPSPNPVNSSEPSAPPPIEPSPEPTPSPLPELDDPDGTDLATGSIIIVGDRAMEIVSSTPSIVTKYAAAINLYAEKMPNSRIINLITPNGGAFYSPEEYRSGIHDQQAMISEMYGQLDEGIVAVDAYSKQRAHIDEYLFFRTDHHWTQLGAYYAYAAMCDALEIDVVPLEDFETGEIPNFVGSMYGFTSKYPQSSVLKNNPDTVHWWRPMRDFQGRVYTDSRMNESSAFNIAVIASATQASNKYLIFISGDNPLTKITTDVDNGKKIAVIKESYGNAFVPYLVNHYEEIYVIDPRKFNGADKPSFNLPAFVEEHEIGDVLVIDYPLVVSNDNYIGILRSMIK